MKDLCLGPGVDDEILDQITDLARFHFNAPIVLISIVEGNRQWFLSKIGVPVSETPRNVSFCAHTLFTHEFLEVPDALEDTRFKENLLVTSAPYIRYYAGAPLTTKDGIGLGALCIIDTKPRPDMGIRERGHLQRFAQLVMTRIETLRSSNFIDIHSGLNNYARLEADIKSLNTRNSTSLIIIDLLSPETLNTIIRTLGHGFFLELMGAAQQSILSRLPIGTTLYKVSGKRFGILVKSKFCESLIGELIVCLTRPVLCRGIPISMNMGIGILPVDLDLHAPDDHIRLTISAADEARSKDSNWSLYEPLLDAAQQRRFTLLSSLRNAIESPDQLYLMFQPRVNAASGQCTGVEALLRWNHPLLGEISPAEFIPLAEKTALMRPLTLCVLEKVIRQAANWKERDLDFTIAMNITINDLENANFTNTFISMALAFDVPFSMLEVEITENESAKNIDSTKKHLEKIKSLGTLIAIDDFGTGYSNWGYLRQLPISIVKIDKSIVQNSEIDLAAENLARTLVNLSSLLGYRVIAEGVETKECFEKMKNWGCEEIQGYYVAKPMIPMDVENWARGNNG